MNSVEIIARELPVVVLLTGPARGYVKSELSKKEKSNLFIYLLIHTRKLQVFIMLLIYILFHQERKGDQKQLLNLWQVGFPLFQQMLEWLKISLWMDITEV